MKKESFKRWIAVIGNPNAGKSTLFNALTGLRQRVGNYPGVTVEKRTGTAYTLHGEAVELIDLPGMYSLSPRSPDEEIALQVLQGKATGLPRPDAVLCVVDASNLERNLFLVTQVMELGLPVLVALNMVDVAEARGVRIHPDQLEQKIGVKFIPTQAHRGKGLVELRAALGQRMSQAGERKWTMPAPLAAAVGQIAAAWREAQPAEIRAEGKALELLAGSGEGPEGARKLALAWRERFSKEAYDWAAAVAGARFTYLRDVLHQAGVGQGWREVGWTDRIDTLVLHPVAGWGVLAGMMMALFVSIFSIASYPMEWIDSGFSALGQLVLTRMPAGIFRDLLVDGVLAGVGGVVIFLPQILILFFFLGLLEDSGYLARAAFLLDRVMHRVGLSGKSFIPLLSSYACAIPGIMATRTVEDPKDRLTTILVAPLMSCSARIPVYTTLLAAAVPAALFPVWGKATALLGLYALGTGTAFALAWLFRKKMLGGGSPPLILELPPYRMPALRNVLLRMWERALIFLRRAGTVILALSILLWFLSNFPSSSDDASERLAGSFAGQLGHWLEPVIRPLGFDWRIGIGLIASLAAREVFVSTMSIVYHVGGEEEGLVQAMRGAVWPDGSIIYTPATCVALLIFYVYALQCLSTVAVAKRETGGWKWPAFMMAYMTGLAYLGAWLVQVIARFLGA
ncbi:MAG: ferrous iron transport protein B [Verrucomicrobia bacterium]|nr:ferrous iron transport protein B [Verrucomicrobiota bacterium]